MPPARTPATPPVTDLSTRRQPRCRVLKTPLMDRCPNPALTDYGVCLRHLRECADEWHHIRTAALGLPQTGTAA